MCGMNGNPESDYNALGQHHHDALRSLPIWLETGAGINKTVDSHLAITGDQDTFATKNIKTTSQSSGDSGFGNGKLSREHDTEERGH